jgi:hypothetical protein
MSVEAPAPVKDQAGPRRRPGTVWTLAVLLALLAIGAIQGGWAMVSNPTSPLGMPISYLDNTPIADYFLPGVFFLSIAAASLLTAVGLVTRWRWGWAYPIERTVSRRWPWIGAVAIGAILLAFEIIELFLVPFHPVMHPLLLAGSAAILLLPFTPSAAYYLAVEPSQPG